MDIKTKPITGYIPVSKSIGLGDIVEKIAKPIVVLSDSIFKTNISNCGGCKSRRDSLNSLFPSINILK